MNMDLKKDLQSPYIPGKEQIQSKEYDNLKDEIGIKWIKIVMELFWTMLKIFLAK